MITNRGSANGDHLKRQRFENHADVATVKDVNTKHAAQTNKPTNDYKHSCIVTGEQGAPEVDKAGLLRLIPIISSRLGAA
jgi:hypothetical protein